MKVFGERLRTLRLAHSMTQQTLAEMLCSERTTILGWELKDKEPDYQFVVDIADIFDVSIETILLKRHGNGKCRNLMMRIP